jgi:trehalose 6-phosphate synthase
LDEARAKPEEGDKPARTDQIICRNDSIPRIKRWGLFMNDDQDSKTNNNYLTENCSPLIDKALSDRELIIVSNRAPVTFSTDEEGKIQTQRSGGGLVTALTGLVQHIDARWVATAQTEEDKQFHQGTVCIGDENQAITVEFIEPEEQVYFGYYNVISNPLLWFLQHSMWDVVRAPTINRDTWESWDNGYVAVNQQFAKAIVRQIQSAQRPPLVMLHDYHLYLAPGFIRQRLRSRARYTLVHFIHIPWPGPEYWGFLPPRMRGAILQGLCGADLLGFQTREDGLNFLRTCESYLPNARVNYRRGRIKFRNHITYMRDFPISIDVGAIRKLAASSEVAEFRAQFMNLFDGQKLIVRIDRIEPSKNIVRGFQAFEELLEGHPEFRGKVQFVALQVPSRLDVDEYKNYLDESMSAAGRVNAKFGDSEWEPIRIFVGNDYARAVAALQLYDVLLVNSIADGMNLVAKEGPVVNHRDGVLILSEHTGAHQQLESGALVIPPLDVYATTEALNQALTMPLDLRQSMADLLRKSIEQEDIVDWLCRQLETIESLKL